MISSHTRRMIQWCQLCCVSFSAMHLFRTHYIIVFYGDRGLESHLNVAVVVALSDVLHVDVDSLVAVAAVLVVVTAASLTWMIQLFQSWLLVIMRSQYRMTFCSFFISIHVFLDGHHACSCSTKLRWCTNWRKLDAHFRIEFAMIDVRAVHYVIIIII